MRHFKIKCIETFLIEKNLIFEFNIILSSFISLHFSFKINVFTWIFTKHMFRNVHTWGYPYLSIKAQGITLDA